MCHLPVSAALSAVGGLAIRKHDHKPRRSPNDAFDLWLDLLDVSVFQPVEQLLHSLGQRHDQLTEKQKRRRRARRSRGNRCRHAARKARHDRR